MKATSFPAPTTAVVLAGGRGSRMGGRDKGEIRIDGQRLIDSVVGAALETGCRKVIIAGEIQSESAINVLEEPRFGGPVAGLAAALPEVDSPWVLLLACDLPHATRLCRSISEAAGDAPTDDGLVVTAAGRKQWLAGWYRTASLQDSLTRLDKSEGAALRDLMKDLKLRKVEDTEGWSRDIDTPEDLRSVAKPENH